MCLRLEKSATLKVHASANRNESFFLILCSGTQRMQKAEEAYGGVLSIRRKLADVSPDAWTSYRHLWCLIAARTSDDPTLSRCNLGPQYRDPCRTDSKREIRHPYDLGAYGETASNLADGKKLATFADKRTGGIKDLKFFDYIERYEIDCPSSWMGK